MVFTSLPLYSGVMQLIIIIIIDMMINRDVSAIAARYFVNLYELMSETKEHPSKTECAPTSSDAHPALCSGRIMNSPLGFHYMPLV